MIEEATANAGRAAVSRLLQVRQLWEEAAARYFEPRLFLTALQSCITTSRTVTFIVQSNKGSIPDFEPWYEQFRTKFQHDPLMQWAKNARNSIEKQGDIGTLSQVRASIIASYLDAEVPTTDWMQQDLFCSPQQIYFTVPNRFRIPHVVENGTLLIERRWVDTAWPSQEVLEALAHVYHELAEMVVSLLRHIGMEVPPAILDTTPSVMASLAMDRALYLSMRDGSKTGYRFYTKEIENNKAPAILKRYGNRVLWQNVGEATSFSALSGAYFNIARSVILKDNYHQSMALFTRDNAVIRVANAESQNRALKYVIMRDLAKLSKVLAADGVILIGEAWTASRLDIPASGFAADAPNRGEALFLIAANSQGELYEYEASIERSKLRRKKVKRLGVTILSEGDFVFMMAPFQKEWGCLDEEKLKASLDVAEELGIETPMIPSDLASPDKL